MKTSTKVALVFGVAAAGLMYLKLRRAPAPKGSKILLFGDSLMEGIGPKLAAALSVAGYEPVVRAVRGSTAAGWLSQMNDLLASVGPSLVIVSLGTNDAVAKDATSLLSLLNQLSAYGEVVALRPPPMPFDTSDVLAAIETSGVPSLPGHMEHRADDGVHFTPDGYAMWATEIFEGLKRLRAIEG